MFLLSPGVNPMETIDALAKKRRQAMEVVSMGEGQDAVAMRALHRAAAAGSWVVLQVCARIVLCLFKLLHSYCLLALRIVSLAWI